eukprot:6184347-Pleurochrysis_carterae.AAC.1
MLRNRYLYSPTQGHARRVDVLALSVQGPADRSFSGASQRAPVRWACLHGGTRLSRAPCFEYKTSPGHCARQFLSYSCGHSFR